MNTGLTGLEIVDCCIGTISSKEDHSAVFRVSTPELRASEFGALALWHGRACTVTIKPHDNAPHEMLEVTTERGEKTPSQRLRAVLFVAFMQGVDRRDGEDADEFYRRQIYRMCEDWKKTLKD